MNNIKLWDHQSAAVARAHPSKTNCFGLFFEQGCGKTLTFAEILKNVYSHEREILPTLIFCPVSVCVQWERELLRFTDFPAGTIINVGGRATSRGAKLLKALSEDPKRIVIANYEISTTKQIRSLFLGNWKPKVIVCDESHKVKNHTAIRSKFVHDLCKNALYRYIGTGTPFTNTYADIWSQMYCLDLGQRFFSTFRQFRQMFFVDKNAHMPRHCYFPDWQPKPFAGTQIATLMDDCTMSVKKEECLDLPPLVKQKVVVPMAYAQQRLYHTMELDAIAMVEKGVMTANLVITKILRMQQITSGFATLDDGTITDTGGNPKLKALTEIVDQIPFPQKAIIWCNFHEEIKQIKRMLIEKNHGFVELHGETPQSIRQRNIDAFCDEANHDVRFLISNPKAGGTGLNLIAAKYAIFYSRSYSLEEDQQAEARNYRAGSEKHDKITRIDILIEDSIDELIYQSIQDKKEIADSVMNYFQDKFNKKHKVRAYNEALYQHFGPSTEFSEEEEELFKRQYEREKGKIDE